MARLVLPSRLELKRPDGSSSEAPLAKVIFTAFLYVSPRQSLSFLIFASICREGESSLLSFEPLFFMVVVAFLRVVVARPPLTFVRRCVTRCATWWHAEARTCTDRKIAAGTAGAVASRPPRQE